jgi:hypothetical protein
MTNQALHARRVKDFVMPVQENEITSKRIKMSVTSFIDDPPSYLIRNGAFKFSKKNMTLRKEVEISEASSPLPSADPALRALS